jgi:hypothetical protein
MKRDFRIRKVTLRDVGEPELLGIAGGTSYTDNTNCHQDTCPSNPGYNTCQATCTEYCTTTCPASNQQGGTCTCVTTCNGC